MDSENPAKQPRNVSSFVTLEQIAQVLYVEDWTIWYLGGKQGKEPHLLSRERIRQIETTALQKCARWMKWRQLSSWDWFDG